MVKTDFKKSVRIADLRECYGSMLAALVREGIDSAAAESLLSSTASANCIRCGTGVTGPELSVFGLRGSDGSENSPEQQRLSENHCALDGCPCFFYELRLAASEGVDWEAVWMKAEQLRAGPGELDRDLVATLRSFLGDFGMAKVVLCAVLVLALAVRLYIWFHTPSWAKPVYRYQAAPDQAPERAAE